MSSNDIAIHVSNLSKCYDIYNRPADRLKQFIFPRLQGLVGKMPGQFYREFWALNGVGFEVKKGETVGIIGRNGSGKSTLLQIICGTLTPTLGEVETNGRIAALLELGSGFNPEFTGRENVYMNGAILGLARAEIDTRFDAIVDYADIGDFIDQPVKTYSSGMLVRLAFSVSVNIDPDILVIDEALAVGDAEFQFKCMERLDHLTRSGVTLLFVSHDLGTVRAFCNHAIYLEKGVIKATGAAEDVTELYLLDLHNAHRKTVSGGPSVKLKPTIGGDQGITFGTEEGNVTSAVFAYTNTDRCVFRKGDQVEVKTRLLTRNEQP